MAHLIKDLIENEWNAFEKTAKENNPRKLAALQIIYDIEIDHESLEAILSNTINKTQTAESEKPLGSSQ